MNAALTLFLTEGLRIESIVRAPTVEEIGAFRTFMSEPTVTVKTVCVLQEVFTPGRPLRTISGMDVRVGTHIPLRGGPDIKPMLEGICAAANKPDSNPWHVHVSFETLHPFMDGNGRTGRALWAWQMRRIGNDPFELSFLHRWYYQTLEHSRL